MAKSTFPSALLGLALLGLGSLTARSDDTAPPGELSGRFGMSAAHLFRIYQAPPPLELPWPPSTLDEWEQQRPNYTAALRRALTLSADDAQQEQSVHFRYTKPDRVTPAFTLKYIAYESQPRFWVTANLYIPSGAIFPAPTVLVIHGHTDTGKATDYLQPLILNLVNKGYAVFAKDGIGKGERADTGHNYGRQAPFTYMSGISLDGLETRDNLHAVDLLCSEALNEWVDTDRIGVVGMSGGAMQTFNLALVDQRIKAAAPICQRNTYTAEFPLWEHCICCVCATGIRRTAEQYHLLATAAPRPFLICSGTEDKNHPLEGARELVRQARRVYELYGKGDHLQFVVDNVGHELTPKFRRAVYAFFNEHLNVDASVVDEPVKLLSSEELECGLPDESTTTIAGLVYRRSLELPPRTGRFDDAAEFDSYRKELIRTIRDEVFGYAAYMPQKCALNATIHEKDTNGAYHRESVTYQSEADVTLSATFVYPAGASDIPAIITIDSSDDDRRALVDAGYAVLSVTLRDDAGDSRRYGNNWGVWARGMSCGKPSTGMRVYDILRSIDYLETRQEIVDSSRIGYLGTGSTGNAMYGLYAAALDDRLACTVLEAPVTTYKPQTEDTLSWHDWDLDIYIPQILLYADVSQVASLVAPRPLVIFDGRDIANRRLSVADARTQLSTCQNGYDLLQSGDKLSIVDASQKADYVSWFDAHLARAR